LLPRKHTVSSPSVMSSARYADMDDGLEIVIQSTYDSTIRASCSDPRFAGDRQSWWDYLYVRR